MSMNSKIRSLIDEIFSEMKMSAENLALRDELMANALAHYEDEIAKGRTEDEALEEVADSLGDVRSLLAEMNAGKEEAAPKPEEKEKPRPFWSAMEEDGAGQKTDEKKPAEKEKTGPFWSEGMDGAAGTDESRADGESKEVSLEETIGKAFGALGEWGRQVVPQMERFVRKADRATGGVMGDLGRAVGKGVRDVTKAAGDTLDRMAKPREEAAPEAKEAAMTPDEMRKKAAGIRAEAELKQAAGDQEGARDMRRSAYELETAAEAAEQAEAIRCAAQEAAANAKASKEEDAPAQPEEPDPQEQDGDAPATAEWLGADGEIDHEKFAKAVDDLAEKAESAAREAHDAAFRMEETAKDTVVTFRFPAAGLRVVDVAVDADDVTIEQGSGDTVEVTWEAGTSDGETPECEMRDHCLTVRRRNPDIFKTFFSVFSKEGGNLTIRVPHGYAAQYKVNTTSGDVAFEGADADEIVVITTSGGVRLAPDAAFRAGELKATTVSGPVTVSACADTVAAKTVSGAIFISCDAVRTDADSVSGRVHIEGACDTWEVNTVSGEAELLCTVAPAGKIVIGTVSANAHVALPETIRGFVAEAAGPNATVVNEFGPNRYGTCALPIRLETLNGRLVIKRL